VDQTLFLLKHHVRFKRLTVRTELDRSVGGAVLGNAEQLVQVLMALLLNAADAVEERQGAAEAVTGAASGGSGASGGAARGIFGRGTRGAVTSSVTVRTGRRTGSGPGSTVVIEVVDDGVGIARSAIPKIFEPFYTSKPLGRGTGLGLSVCYGIVADHGGRMEVDSEVGRGSTFRVILPAGETATAPVAAEERRLA
jgi:signal transduction histidine kinase